MNFTLGSCRSLPLSVLPVALRFGVRHRLVPKNLFFIRVFSKMDSNHDCSTNVCVGYSVCGFGAVRLCGGVRNASVFFLNILIVHRKLHSPCFSLLPTLVWAYTAQKDLGSFRACRGAYIPVYSRPFLFLKNALFARLIRLLTLLPQTRNNPPPRLSLACLWTHGTTRMAGYSTVA